MAVSEQEKAATREALKREIARNARLVSMYESKIRTVEKLEGSEREVMRCTTLIEKSKRTIEIAAAELGINPPAVEKRGPGRPPKSSYQQ